jgi:hypothetical protein
VVWDAAWKQQTFAGCLGWKQKIIALKQGECRSVSPERCAEICESASFRLTDHTVGLFKD